MLSQMQHANDVPNFVEGGKGQWVRDRPSSKCPWQGMLHARNGMGLPWHGVVGQLVKVKLVSIWFSARHVAV
jgi:hypothetical protein